MDATDVGVDEASSPRFGGVSRILEPEGFAGRERTKPIEVAIVIDVKALAVDALACSTREGVEEGFLPIGSDEEADFARVAGDDINFAIAGVVASGGRIDGSAFVFADEVFFPDRVCSLRWHQRA